MFSLKFVEDNILGLAISRRSKLNKIRYSKPQQFSLMSSSLSSPHFHLTIILTLSLTYTMINYQFPQKLKWVERPRILDVKIQGFKCLMWDFLILNTSPHVWRNQPNMWTNDIEWYRGNKLITHLDTILKIEHPTNQNQLAIDRKTQELIYRDAMF